MNKLIIFKRSNYKYLKDELEAKGMELIDLARVHSFMKGETYLEDFDPSLQVIDISSLGNMDFKDNTIKVIFPEIVRNHFDSATFISDCNDEEFKDNMGYTFTIEEYRPNIDLAVIDEGSLSEIKEQSKKLLTNLSKVEIENLITSFNKSLIGHERFKEDLLDKVIEFKLFNAIKENKIFSIFIMGNSGVGKTEVAKLLHKQLGGNKHIAKINFGNYSSQDSLNSLIGSPRGYIGSESGELFDKIKNSNVGLILIDEFEKATPALFNYFLEVLESGYATSMLGEEIDLSGYIIIFTSNINDIDFEKTFSPELRSRFNYVSSFNPLTMADKKNYLYTRFSKYVEEYNEVFSKRMRKLDKEELDRKIQVEKYQNMRMLNKAIRELFLSHVKEKYPKSTDKIWR
uniref:ATP-dependent protease ATP-binding subunit n=1 Tax=Listeria seeligeri TaxID=1640 RepID=A0A7T0MAV8_LISSE|nr:AAA family ATPase [Listeria seeligeri]QPL19396.1 ATP-dependent protease ATP-binding subunit [Listeria seeligeri]